MVYKLFSDPADSVLYLFIPGQAEQQEVQCRPVYLSLQAGLLHSFRLILETLR